MEGGGGGGNICLSKKALNSWKNVAMHLYVI